MLSAAVAVVEPRVVAYQLPLHCLLQSLVYSHALLSLWHENAVAAIADVDEYLVTAKKASIREARADHITTLLHACMLSINLCPPCGSCGSGCSVVWLSCVLASPS